jgi:hypothetical protein
MKNMLFMVTLLGLPAHTLSASEGQIKREFTVTSIALDQQHDLMMQEENSEENNTSTEKTNTEGGAAEN